MFSGSFRAGVVKEPDLPNLPLQSPLATHSVASVALQRRLAVLPSSTDSGRAEKVTTGTGTTSTLTDSRSVPAAFLHDSV